MTGWRSNINTYSASESELWRNAALSVFQLQEAMLKIDKIRPNLHILYLNVSVYKLFEYPSYHVVIFVP